MQSSRIDRGYAFSRRKPEAARAVFHRRGLKPTHALHAGQPVGKIKQLARDFGRPTRCRLFQLLAGDPNHAAV